MSQKSEHLEYKEGLNLPNQEVDSLSIILAISTVNIGAEDLTVSVNDTVT